MYCNRVGLRQNIGCLDRGLNRRNDHACDCTGGNCGVEGLHDRRSRLCRQNRRDKCACWLDGRLSERLSWQGLRCRDERCRGSLDAGESRSTSQPSLRTLSAAISER